MLQGQLTKYILGALFFLAVGAVIGTNMSPAEVESAYGDRIVVTTGAKGAAADLPITAAAAVEAGWKDLVRCFRGKGRYFEHIDAEGNLNPFVLAYNNEDELIGVYLTSKIEMPAPWEYKPNGLLGVTNYEFEHWSLPVYLRIQSADPYNPQTRHHSRA